MRRLRIRFTALILAFVACAGREAATPAGGGPAVADASPGGGILRLAWLAGCWQRASGGRIVDEQWMAPRGGMMLGMSRTVRDGRAVEWEAIRIEERGGKLAFVASPSGQSTTEFLSAEIGDDGVVFENPAHDFPQRVIYRRGAADSLWARIEGERSGQLRGVDFRMARVRCAG